MVKNHPFGRACVGLVALSVLAGCGSDLSRSFGLSRDTPDEFQVTTRAPLALPPSYQLRPPRPGAPRPQEDAPDTAGEAVLVPQSVLQNARTAGTTSPGQTALVDAAGPSAPAGIRNKVDAESALDRGNRSFVDRLMFWKATPPPGTVVDPTGESQRLRENAALGQSPETGNTPIIQKSKPGLLNSLF